MNPLAPISALPIRSHRTILYETLVELKLSGMLEDPEGGYRIVSAGSILSHDSQDRAVVSGSGGFRSLQAARKEPSKAIP